MWLRMEKVTAAAAAVVVLLAALVPAAVAGRAASLRSNGVARKTSSGPGRSELQLGHTQVPPPLHPHPVPGPAPSPHWNAEQAKIAAATYPRAEYELRRGHWDAHYEWAVEQEMKAKEEMAVAAAMARMNRARALGMMGTTTGMPGMTTTGGVGAATTTGGMGPATTGGVTTTGGFGMTTTGGLGMTTTGLGMSTTTGSPEGFQARTPDPEIYSPSTTPQIPAWVSVDNLRLVLDKLDKSMKHHIIPNIVKMELCRHGYRMYCVPGIPPPMPPPMPGPGPGPAPAPGPGPGPFPGPGPAPGPGPGPGPGPAPAR
eukprot:gnl/TRDRNA2_/TRDRNA2_183254_c0_seq1.p1 gnl/TRDRNA2_/TRDRNA2_183254_c0~~gnl/TRDRNA2_/TRDRNA2_183254_c0_seq1.p1  ORF type:complete len:314 (+),score=39.92 gnl/TRDRNA2_/TRDRNA2_183254_c0_seq1:139-1080(+)